MYSLRDMRLGGMGVLATAFMLLAGCSHRDSATNTQAAEVPAATVVAAVRGPMDRTLSLAGQFEPYQMVDVHAKVSGYIRHINVDIGDKVHAGQVLAVLEVPELAAQLRGAGSEVARSKDEIARARNEVTRAESSHSALHANYIRLRDASAAQPGIIAQQELDDAHARDLAAEAQVDSAKSALSAAQQQAGVASANEERVGAMENYTTVTAPLNGVITWRYADTGALIQAGTNSDTQSMPVVKLSQSDLLRLRVPVPEDDVQFIRIGAPVTVRVEALHRSFAGKVVRYTRNVSLETRTMETEIDVPNANLSIDPGMYANVTLQLEHKPDALMIPDGAVLRNGNADTVLVLDAQNRVQSRPVTLGMQGSKAVEITSGLQPGERVITGGQAKYQVGEVVDPQVQTLHLGDASKADGSDAAGGQD